MLKAFIPVAVCILSFTLGLEKPSAIQLVIVSVISCGVVISTYGEMSFSWIGFYFQLAAICCESTRLVLSDQLLKDLKLDPLSMLFYMSPVSLFFIAVGFVSFELADFPFERLADGWLIGALLLSCLTAFGLNVAVVLLITNASALTMTLGGIAKDIMLVFLSMLLFHAPVTAIQFAGYALSLSAMNSYKNYKTDPAAYIAKIEEFASQISVSLRPRASDRLAAAAAVIAAEERKGLVSGSGSGRSSHGSNGGLELAHTASEEDELDSLMPGSSSSSANRV
jgi:hypothetical protein